MWTSTETAYNPLRICPRSVMSGFSTAHPVRISSFPTRYDRISFNLSEEKLV